MDSSMPTAGEILVWTMDVAAAPATTVAHWRLCLDESEQTRADRFHFEADRTTFVAAHWLLRHALAETDGLPSARWRFVSEENGKPQIDPALGRPGLQFNLSHSRGFAACAVTRDAPIGIDVETVSARRSSLEIAESFFSPAEIAILRMAPPDKQRRTFYRLWTLKEAYIKATGEGLRRRLDSFSFSLDPTTVAFHPGDPAEADRWTFVERRPTPRHVLAIATRQPRATRVRLASLACSADGRIEGADQSGAMAAS